MALIDGCLAYYKLDDNAANTTVADAHTNNYDGTASTNTSNLASGAGIINGCFDVTAASSENVTIAQDLSGASWAVSCWIKYGSVGSTGSVYLVDRRDATGDVTRNYAVLVKLGSSYGIGGSFYSPTDSGWKNIGRQTHKADGAWHHVVLTYEDGSGAILYIDGSKDDDVASSDCYTDATDSTKLCSDFSDAAEWDDGIDEVGIWNRYLTPSEVSDLYNSGSGLAYPFTPPAVTTVTPSAIALALTLQTPIHSIKNLPSTLQLSTTTGAPIKHVLHLASAVTLTGGINAPSISADCILSIASALQLTTTGYSPVHTLIKIPSVLSLTGATHQPSDYIIVYTPSTLNISTTGQAPTTSITVSVTALAAAISVEQQSIVMEFPQRVLRTIGTGEIRKDRWRLNPIGAVYG